MYVNGDSGLRGKVAAFADEEGDEDFVVGGDLAEGLGEGVVLLLVEGVELLGVVDGDDGDAAAVVGRDYGWGGHGGGELGAPVGLQEETMEEEKGSRFRDAHGDVGHWFWWLMEMAMEGVKRHPVAEGDGTPHAFWGHASAPRTLSHLVLDPDRGWRRTGRGWPAGG